MKYQTMFERDLLTVFSYLLLGFFMLSRSVLAPFISYRSAENPEDTAVLGFHVTLSAVGIILVGVFWKRISSKYSGKYLLYSSVLSLLLFSRWLRAAVGWAGGAAWPYPGSCLLCFSAFTVEPSLKHFWPGPLRMTDGEGQAFPEYSGAGYCFLSSAVLLSGA